MKLRGKLLNAWERLEEERMGFLKWEYSLWVSNKGIEIEAQSIKTIRIKSHFFVLYFFNIQAKNNIMRKTIKYRI